MGICRNESTSNLFAKLVNPLLCLVIILALLYVGQDILKPFVFSCLLALLFVSPCAFFERQGFPRALAGLVVSMREDSDKGGLKPEMLSEGNYIIIQHSDGTHANYWHLKKNGALVNPGDTVQQGQVIGLSGNTGYSAFAHLHFEVVDPEKGQIPTRFNTNKGIKYLRPLKWHKAI